MRDFHRNLTMQLRQQSANDGRWLIFGYPPNPAYSNSQLDERQVECVYAAQVMRQYFSSVPEWALDALECGAATHPDACKLSRYWRPYRVQWTGIDIKPIMGEFFSETIESSIGQANLEGFSLILALSTIEHSAFVGDTVCAALASLRAGLANQGILILSWPVGRTFDYTDFHQFSPQESREAFDKAKLQIVHERLWRWNSEYFENCLEEDVAGVQYRLTNRAVGAGGVGCWTLAR